MNRARRDIWNKSAGRCWYCGIALSDKGWHADHFNPIRRNWWENTSLKPENDTKDNLVPTCASCNIQKGSLSVEQFRQKVQGFINSLNQYHTQYSVAKRYGLIQEVEKPIRFWFEDNIGHTG
jgi:5-methylcytosine-specific restriction endonuclease McrA